MKNYTRIIVAVTLLFGLSVAAKAQSETGIVVNLPFKFVVRGKTLPAGTYTAKQLSIDRFGGVRLTNRANSSSVFVLPNEVKNASAFMPKVSFQRVGEHYFLSAIQTADDVYNFPISPSALMEAAAKSHDTASYSVSVSAAGN
jgi:hypothetical protein